MKMKFIDQSKYGLLIIAQCSHSNLIYVIFHMPNEMVLTLHIELQHSKLFHIQVETQCITWYCDQ